MNAPQNLLAQQCNAAGARVMHRPAANGQERTMRKRIFAMASSAALAVATASVPAGAMPLPGGGGVAFDANVIQVQGKEMRGGPGGGGFSGGTGGNVAGSISRGGDGPGGNIRGSFGGRAGPDAGGRAGADAGVTVRRGDGPGVSGRGQVSGEQRFTREGDSRPRGRVGNSDRRDFSYGGNSRKGDFSRWAGNRPHIRHRGWSRDHRHRFFGAFLIGVPFGYAAVSSHPCYDWFYGPQGWGYYWSYDRCPV
jgi:hypothetical protein